jgi:hypothetical protein
MMTYSHSLAESIIRNCSQDVDSVIDSTHQLKVTHDYLWNDQIQMHPNIDGWWKMPYEQSRDLLLINYVADEKECAPIHAYTIANASTTEALTNSSMLQITCNDIIYVFNVKEQPVIFIGTNVLECDVVMTDIGVDIVNNTVGNGSGGGGGSGSGSGSGSGIQGVVFVISDRVLYVDLGVFQEIHILDERGTYADASDICRHRRSFNLTSDTHDNTLKIGSNILRFNSKI